MNRPIALYTKPNLFSSYRRYPNYEISLTGVRSREVSAYEQYMTRIERAQKYTSEYFLKA